MSEIFWGIYRLFHDPPNTPKEIKCIGCKVGAGCTGILATGLILAKGISLLKTRGYLASACGVASIFTLSASAVAFKLASEDYEYNQRLIEAHKEYMSKTRLEKPINRNELAS